MRRGLCNLAQIASGAALLAFLAGLGGAVQAGDPPATSVPGEVTLRKRLEDRGVLFNFTYAADVIGVVSGGIKRGAFYNGFLDLGTDIDFEKLLGWKGTHFHVNGFYPHGENGSANYVGDIGTFSNIEAYDTYRLYELWVEQEFFDSRFSLRVGQITFDSEFAVLDAYGGLFVQSGFGAPEAFSANLPLPVFPNAAPGIRARFTPIKGLSMQAAVFDGNVAPGLTPDHSPNAVLSTEFNRHGTDWALRPDEGAFFVGEVSYRFNQMKEEEASATRTNADSGRCSAGGTGVPERGLAGSYEVGFLYHTDGFADTYDVTLLGLHSSLAPVVARNGGVDYAIYLNVEQEIWREPGTEMQGLGIFGHAAWMPEDRNFVAFSFEGGLHYLGVIPGREKDALGLGVACIGISDRVANAVRDTNRRDHTSHRPADFEATIELVYRYQMAPWFSIQPHVQYVVQPGGTTELANALILGVRTNIVF